MTTQHQTFKKAYGLELLKIAQDDFESVEVLAGTKKGRRENICFLAQQVVEKSIKAALCHLEIPVPLSHNLELLIDKIPSEKHPPAATRLALLSEFATVRRYEEGKYELSQDDVNAVVETAKSTLEWAAQIIE